MKFNYSGLNEEDVQRSRASGGSNAVTSQEVESFFDKLRNNASDPIILILVVALVVTMVMTLLGFSPWYEGVGIAIAVLLAILVSTWSEYSNESTFQKLLEEASLVKVKAFRSNALHEISINDLVVGDTVLLQPGDTIPADGFLLDGHLEINQSALTGESETVRKKATLDPKNFQEEENGLFRASLVDDGEAAMVITAVGDKTKYGATLKELISSEDRLSPLQQKLALLGQQIAKFGYLGATFIALAFMFNHIFLQSESIAVYFSQPWGVIIHHLVSAIILGIIIIVVAVPEGLPMMIAVVLSLNMRKLLNAKVLVRKLLGIETAGSLTVLFTDKTGTLTRGELAVTDFFTGDGTHYQTMDSLPENLQKILAFSLFHNTSAVLDTKDPANIGVVGANRTEQAMLQFIGPMLANQEAAEVTAAIPFSSAHKFSAVQVKGKQSLTLIKGAPEILLPFCQSYWTAEGKGDKLENPEQIRREMEQMSKRAMRLIAVAVSEEAIQGERKIPDDLQLLGIFGLRDELRKEAPGAVKTAKEAGIHVVMITGDAKETAEAIALDVGLLEENAVITTSSDLSKISDQQLKEMLPQLSVVARAFPTDKSRLVKTAQELGWVVGMTGDGVNDAPAVKNADVGFAMGSGTEMTKESSDIVILDDNFSSLTQAVLYGRTLFKSVRKFLIFQLSTNVAAILVAFLGPFLGNELPLTMTQLLWINLIMDTLAAIAFAGEAALNRTMHEQPISRDAPLINGDMWSAILIQGSAMAFLSLLFLNSPWIFQLFRGDEKVLLSAFFAFFVFINNFNKFNARTETLNLLDHLWENKNFIWVTVIIFALQVVFTYLGGEILRTVGLTPLEWLYVTLFSLIIIPIDLIRKTVRSKIC
ncbi:MAG: calcium-translocating P-type ATPase, PMCA-type [SAR324 cluster bacterium]|nr:calcium-translocating P-type ATPase, PMCA-type [SAR324 cluster bacterium]